MIAVADRFSRAIREHLVLSLVELPTHAVIMGIFGPPGEGKTYQLRSVLQELGVSVRSINAADFESDRAGLPGKELLRSYVEASDEIKRKCPACLVIDDIDTTVGEWEGNTGTVNHQQLLAQLMHLADRPREVEHIGQINRVPIFVTGNDFSKLYPPLRRPGRMNVLHWSPTIEERRDIVSSILNDVLHGEIISRLVNAYPNHPVSFFADLRSRLVSRGAQSIIVGLSERIALICGEPDLYRAHVERAVRDGLDLNVVTRIAEVLHAEHQAANQAYLDPLYLLRQEN